MEIVQSDLPQGSEVSREKYFSRKETEEIRHLHPWSRNHEEVQERHQVQVNALIYKYNENGG